MVHLFISSGAFFAFTGVIARSLSSHAIYSFLEQKGKLVNFNLAADYLIMHGLALLAIAILSNLYPEAKYYRIGWLFILGSLLFQGSVLIKSCISIQPLGFLTPLGGFMLIVAWGWLIVLSFISFLRKI